MSSGSRPRGFARADRREVLERERDVRVRESVIAVAALGLDAQQPAVEQLAKSLRPLVGGEPTLEVAVDPELIGGIVVRVGDTVYDGSVARQLERLKSQMITRSVHEIQSRRDRFRHSGGN